MSRAVDQPSRARPDRAIDRALRRRPRTLESFWDNGWTGGQYSVFRVLFGAYLFVHFAQLLPWGVELFSNRGVLADGGASPLLALFPNVLLLSDTPAVVTGLLAIATALSVMFALGWRDRIAAVGMWYVLACLFGRNPLIANPSLPYVGWMLLAHACLPPRPYGSLEARGRVDPRGGWHMPGAIFLAAWIVMAAGYSYSGYTKLVSPSWIDGSAMERVLTNPLARPSFVRDWMLMLPAPLMRLATWGSLALEVLFVPLALWRVTRPWAWLAMLSMHLGLLVLIDFADLSLGMVMLHLFTFTPAWLAARRPSETEMIFYDGYCGLCHRAARFVLSEDRTGTLFRLAPLQSASFEAATTPQERAALPDSMAVKTSDGRLLNQSSAAAHLLDRIGGMWRIVAWLLWAIPRPLRDAGYGFIASIRHRLFTRPTDACPMMPPDLRSRFDH